MQFSIRKATTDDLRQISYIHVDCWREAYCGIIEKILLDRLSYGKSYENFKFTFQRGTQLFFVAEVDGQIVGFAVGGISRDEDLLYEGEIYAMYVRKEFHKIGIGKAFILTFAEEFKKLNWQNFIVWCLKKNKTCGFYEKMGGFQEESKKITIGSKKMTKYGFIYDTEATIELLKEE